MKTTTILAAAAIAMSSLAALPAMAENRVTLGYQNISVDGVGDLDGVAFRQFARGQGFESSWDGFVSDTDLGTLFLSDAELS